MKIKSEFKVYCTEHAHFYANSNGEISFIDDGCSIVIRIPNPKQFFASVEKLKQYYSNNVEKESLTIPIPLLQNGEDVDFETPFQHINGKVYTLVENKEYDKTCCEMCAFTESSKECERSPDCTNGYFVEVK